MSPMTSGGPPIRMAPARVLSQMPAFSTADVGEAHQVISDLFCEHHLEPLEHHVEMTLRSTHAGPMGLDLLDYGAPVRISPQALQDFFLVQIPLRGRAEISVSGTTHYSDTSAASVPPVDRAFSMVWHEDTPQLVLYVERRALERVAATIAGVARPHRLQLDYTINLTTPGGQAFLRGVRSYHSDVNTDIPALANPYVRKLMQEGVMARMLLAATSDGIPALQGGASGRRGESLYGRFQDVLDRHAHEEISVLDIAETLGVSTRTLQVAVHATTGETPFTLLRQAKLRLAHTRLMGTDDRDTTVTDVALACGFSHLGRFATHYHRAFGEYPSDTLRRR